MRKFECPQCGAPLEVHLPTSVWAVCAYCDSTLVLTDDAAEVQGKMARLTQDVSPLQLGSTGVYTDRSFTLIGRIQQKWERGWWNEWHALFDDGSSGWLTDAQGMYAFSVEVPHSKLPDHRWFDEDVSAGDQLRLNDHHFIVNDVKRVYVRTADGELPFAAPAGREAITVDMIGRRNRFGTLESHVDQGVHFYEGFYLPFKKLKLQNLREFAGW